MTPEEFAGEVAAELAARNADMPPTRSSRPEDLAAGRTEDRPAADGGRLVTERPRLAGGSSRATLLT